MKAKREERKVKKVDETNRRKRQIKFRKDYLVRLLKNQGKWSSELAPQAELAASLKVHLDSLETMRDTEGYDPVVVETSREGNTRMEIHPMEILCCQYYDRYQRALKALGMNIDSKERKGDGKDSFADFLESMSERE